MHCWERAEHVEDLAAGVLAHRPAVDAAHDPGDEEEFGDAEITERAERVRHSGVGRAVARFIEAVGHAGDFDQQRTLDGVADYLPRHEGHYELVPVVEPVIIGLRSGAQVDLHDRVLELSAAAGDQILEVPDEIDLGDVLEPRRLSSPRDRAVILCARHPKHAAQHDDERQDRRHRAPSLEPQGEGDDQEELERLAALARDEYPVEVKRSVAEDDREREPGWPARGAQCGDREAEDKHLGEEQQDDRNAADRGGDHGIRRQPADRHVEARASRGKGGRRKEQAAFVQRDRPWQQWPGGAAPAEGRHPEAGGREQKRPREAILR